MAPRLRERLAPMGCRRRLNTEPSRAPRPTGYNALDAHGFPRYSKTGASVMPPRIAFFDVDTQQPAADMRGLVFRPRVQPFADNLERLLATAKDRNIIVVSTACVNAGPIERALSPDVLFIGIDDDPSCWENKIHSYRCFFVQKRSHGGPAINIRTRAFDPFVANPNADRLIRALDVERWVVFGDSAGYCFRSTVEGLLRRGCCVTALSDTVGVGVDSVEVRDSVLLELERRGATLRRSADVMAGCL